MEKRMTRSDVIGITLRPILYQGNRYTNVIVDYHDPVAGVLRVCMSRLNRVATIPESEISHFVLRQNMYMRQEHMR